MKRAWAGVIALAGAVATASCGQPKQMFVDNAYVRLPAVPGRPAAAYFTLHGGPDAATLISVSSDVAIRTEMHETKTAADGTSTMAPVMQLPVPADATLRFGAGGRHVMMFDVNPGIKPGSAVPMMFSFGSGLRIQYNATAIAAGAPAPKPT